MNKTLAICILLLGAATLLPAQPLSIDTCIVRGDTCWANFWLQVPESYNPQTPPAILIWWHQYGADRHEMTGSQFSGEANERGWIAASHSGPEPAHYNSPLGLEHCKLMLDWIHENYPFSLDSIYMVGGSMGGAAPQIFHNNYCGIHSYPLAAAAGGSPILDCQYRQEQYLRNGQVNNAMRRNFGGLPADCSAIAFMYHRSSAIFAADTAESMHFNSLTVPNWVTWGASVDEDSSYGVIGRVWDLQRRSLGADSTVCFQSTIGGHGLGVMPADSICNWLSGFSLNRYPDEISINADEDDQYYWTRVELADTHAVFGRYGARKDSGNKRLDITLVRNVAQLEVLFEFPWPARWDTLRGSWLNLAVDSVPQAVIVLREVPEVGAVLDDGGEPVPFVYTDSSVSVTITTGGNYLLLFGTSSAAERPVTRPADAQLVTAYPNPFNSRVTLEIESAWAEQRELRLYDITGRVVQTLTASLIPGRNRISFAADGLSSGIYFAVLRDSGQRPLKLMLLR